MILQLRSFSFVPSAFKSPATAHLYPSRDNSDKEYHERIAECVNQRGKSLHFWHSINFLWKTEGRIMRVTCWYIVNHRPPRGNPRLTLTLNLLNYNKSFPLFVIPDTSK